VTDALPRIKTDNVL